MGKFTFKQYLDSRKQLLDAVTTNPITSNTYNVARYCKLVIGENKQAKSVIALRPSFKLIVEWHHQNNEPPTPISIILEDKSGNNTKYKVLWKGDKLLKWLTKNTIEQSLLDDLRSGDEV